MIGPMPHASGHLNEKQLRVLRWVADGTPSDAHPEGDYSHRITAKALASRGLIRVEGRGASWQAELTAAGKTRVAKLKAVAEAPLEDGSDITALVARLNEAGGRLELDERADGIAYAPLIHKANKSDLRPRGQEFFLSTQRWQTPWLQVLEYREWFWDLIDVPEVPKVPVGSRLSPLAKTFVESKGDQFVTKDSVPRAARVLEAVIRHAEKQGWTVRDPRIIDARDNDRGKRTATWAGHLEIELPTSRNLRMQIREMPKPGGKKFNFYDSDDRYDRQAHDKIKRLPAWQQNRNYWFIPSGRLELRLAPAGHGFDGLKWAETRTRTLEDRLGEVFKHVEVTRLEQEAAAHRAEVAKEQRATLWEAAMETARQRFREHQEEALLIDRARAWRTHQDVVAFVEDLRAREPEATDLRRWVAIGDTVARRLDPYAGLAEPQLPEPTLEELKPFLHGWSPYGPEASK